MGSDDPSHYGAEPTLDHVAEDFLPEPVGHGQLPVRSSTVASARRGVVVEPGCAPVRSPRGPPRRRPLTLTIADGRWRAARPGCLAEAGIASERPERENLGG